MGDTQKDTKQNEAVQREILQKERETPEKEREILQKEGQKNTITSGGRELILYGNAGSSSFFLQPVDEHDAALMDSEAMKLEKLCGHRDWCIVTIPIQSWNEELTPWENPPVFGKEGFGKGAPRTLAYVLEKVIPALEAAYPVKGRHYYLCGYSLAGLFALWSACESDVFAGIAAASPSVWYPGWIEYAGEHPVQSGCVYLSLGNKEEKARNRVMAAVGDAIRGQYSLLQEAGVPCVLEWNEGNHFMDSDGRMARGLAWLLKREGI